MKKIGLRSLLWCSAALLAALPAAAAVDPVQALDGFDAEIEHIMKEANVPGAAVGVVMDGRVILAKGYGVREVGKPETVDADTIFAIGSMSKSFTTTVMATLVEQGKLNWDKPVRDYLPWFQMYDPVATELMTPRDLVTHRSGLPRHDFIRMSTYLTREELVRRLRYLPANHTFRDVFQYNNLMFVTAGFLAGQVAGSSWEELVKQRIFLPLGMNRSNTSTEDSQKQDNIAHPHIRKAGVLKAVPFYNYQQFGAGPNGAVNTSVNDYIKYMEMQLNGGKAGGRQIVSAAEMEEMHKPVTVVDSTGSYALGWFVESHRGYQVFQHSGSITGFNSQVVLIPSQNTGIVVFNNRDSPLPFTIAWDLTDRLLGLKPDDYFAEKRKHEALISAREAKVFQQEEAQRVPGTKPTLDLTAYVGNYFHPAYGVIHVDRDGDGLVIRFNAVNLPLKHFDYDTFRSEGLHINLVQFEIGKFGKVEDLVLPLEENAIPFVFVRR